MDVVAYQERLLSRGRCGRCAEVVSPVAIVRGEECPHCGERLGRAARRVVKSIEVEQRKWRVVGYGLIGLASFLTGWIPLLQVVVQVLALFVLHVVLLRRALNWLPVKRRILARMTMKILGALVGVMGLLINVAVVPLVGVSPFLLGLLGPALTALYVEGGLRIVRRRVEWEVRGEGIGVWEWVIPVGLLGLVFGTATATVVVMMGIMHLVMNLELPGVMEMAGFLGDLGLGSGGGEAGVGGEQ